MNNEVTNYLLAYENMKIIQRKDMFNFSLDTVLLAHFCTINKDLNAIVDFGTNNAAIPLLLSRRTDKKIIGVEIQKDAVDLAIKNVELNPVSYTHLSSFTYVINWIYYFIIYECSNLLSYYCHS